jgi:hypothetical protein
VQQLTKAAAEPETARVTQTGGCDGDSIMRLLVAFLLLASSHHLASANHDASFLLVCGTVNEIYSKHNWQNLSPFSLQVNIDKNIAFTVPDVNFEIYFKTDDEIHIRREFVTKKGMMGSMTGSIERATGKVTMMTHKGSDRGNYELYSHIEAQCRRASP